MFLSLQIIARRRVAEPWPRPVSQPHRGSRQRLRSSLREGSSHRSALRQFCAASRRISDFSSNTVFLTMRPDPPRHHLNSWQPPRPPASVPPAARLDQPGPRAGTAGAAEGEGEAPAEKPRRRDQPTPLSHMEPHKTSAPFPNMAPARLSLPPADRSTCRSR